MTYGLRIFLWFVLLFCMVVLTKNILLKNNRGLHFSDLKKECTIPKIKSRLRTANLKPFSTITLFYNSRRLNADYKMDNLAGNVVGFIPLGILLPLLVYWLRRGWSTVLAVFLFSLGFECCQLFFKLGVFDVDDLILNTAGGVIGYLIYWIARFIVRRANSSERVAN